MQKTIENLEIELEQLDRLLYDDTDFGNRNLRQIGCSLSWLKQALKNDLDLDPVHGIGISSILAALDHNLAVVCSELENLHKKLQTNINKIKTEGGVIYGSAWNI